MLTFLDRDTLGYFHGPLSMPLMGTLWYLGSVAPFLNNQKLYIMGVYKYLEFGLFIFGP